MIAEASWKRFLIADESLLVGNRVYSVDGKSIACDSLVLIFLVGEREEFGVFGRIGPQSNNNGRED